MSSQVVGWLGGLDVRRASADRRGYCYGFTGLFTIAALGTALTLLASGPVAAAP